MCGRDSSSIVVLSLAFTLEVWVMTMREGSYLFSDSFMDMTSHQQNTTDTVAGLQPGSGDPTMTVVSGSTALSQSLISIYSSQNYTAPQISFWSLDWSIFFVCVWAGEREVILRLHFLAIMSKGVWKIMCVEFGSCLYLQMWSAVAHIVSCRQLYLLCRLHVLWYHKSDVKAAVFLNSA